MRSVLGRPLAGALAALALCACRSAAVDVSAPEANPREAASAQEDAAPAAPDGFAGTWQTTYGVMRLKGSGGAR